MGDGLFVHGGVTSALEARLALAGLLALQGPTALDVRTGVLHGPGSTALVTGTSATAPMQVAIGVHDGVLSRGTANGPYLMPTEAVQLVDIGAAPASGTRIDIVWERQKDATAGVPTPDGAYGAEYGVLAGTVGAGEPDLATLGPVGAEELATVAVSAGATRTTDGTVLITNTARQTTTRGGILPVRANDTDAGAHVDQYRGHPTRGLERWDGTRWSTPTPLGVWVNDLFDTAYSYTLVTTLSNPTGMTGRTAPVPPGRTLEVELSGTQVALGANSSAYLQLFVGGVVQDAAAWATGAANLSLPVQLKGSWTNPGDTDASCQYSAAALLQLGTASLRSTTVGVVRLRHRIV